MIDADEKIVHATLTEISSIEAIYLFGNTCGNPHLAFVIEINNL